MNEQTVKAKPPAKSPRRRARELALQGIYQWRLTGEDIELIDKHICDEKGLGRYDSELFKKLLYGVQARHTELEIALTAHLDRELKELSPVEFAVLMLGAFELAYHLEIPYRVVINESVELAKTFGGTDGHKFVNGVLDKLAAQLRSLEMAAK